MFGEVRCDVVKGILERYSRTEDQRYIVDITAQRAADLYNNFDRNTPYIRKDLATDLADYLEDSVAELGKEAFVIQINLLEPAAEEVLQRIHDSVHNYFEYMKELEIRRLVRKMKVAMTLFVAGLIILSLSVWVNQQLEQDSTVWQLILAEGLTIAAWVSLWEALATFLINWLPHRRMIRLYTRITGAEIIFV